MDMCLADNVFKYDSKSSYESNFIIWYDMNCHEKRQFNEQPYEYDKAKAVFDGMYKERS